MLIGEKIKLVRLHRGMTQKELGIMAGLNEKTADIRIAQYESSARTPKAGMLERLAAALGVNSRYFCDFNIHNIKTTEDFILLLLDIEGMAELGLTLYSYGGTEEKVMSIILDNKTLDNFLVDWLECKQALSTDKIKAHDYIEWLLTWIDSINERSGSACQN